MKNLSLIHTKTPLDTNLRLLFVPGVGKNVLRRVGFYEVQWGKWYLSDGYTEVHPKGWSYLNEWDN